MCNEYYIEDYATWSIHEISFINLNKFLKIKLMPHQQGEGLLCCHYDDVIMGALTPQITSLTIVYSTVYSDGGQRKHQSSVSLAFVRGIHRGPVNSSHKWPVIRKMFPFDDVIMVMMFMKTYTYRSDSWFCVDVGIWCQSHPWWRRSTWRWGGHCK